MTFLNEMSERGLHMKAAAPRKQLILNKFYWDL